jgi:hypothetical protein
MGGGSIGNLTGTTYNGITSTTPNSGSYDILGNPIGRYMPMTPAESFGFDGSLRSSDPIMGFVREFVVEFMRKVDSEYKFVRRDHFDEKTYCKVHDGDFITIGDIFDIQLKEEKDEREFRKANAAKVV